MSQAIWAIRLVLGGLLLFEVAYGLRTSVNMMWIGLLGTSGGSWLALEGVQLYLRRRSAPALPALASWLIVAAVVIDAVGNIKNFYSEVHWFDSLVHFISGFALAWALSYLGYSLNHLHALAFPRWAILYGAFSLTVILTVLFEFLEHAIDTLAGSQFWLGSGPDTVTDLIASTLGALASGLISRKVIAFNLGARDAQGDQRLA